MTRRKKLRRLYNMCTPPQQHLFNRMYISVDDIPLKKIDWAIQQCERTIAKNTEDGKHDDAESFFDNNFLNSD